jgi:hypothetical protein
VFKAEKRNEKKAWDEKQARASIANKQAEYTAHIAELIYARGIME